MMSARVELRDVRDNKVLWENPSLIFRDEYDAQGGQSGPVVDPAAFRYACGCVASTVSRR